MTVEGKCGEVVREYRREQSTSNGENRRELRAATQAGAGSTCRSDHLRSSGDRSRWPAARTRGGSHSRCVGAPFRSSGPCDLSRLRLPGKDANSAYSHATWLERRSIPPAVGVTEQSSPDGSSIFRAPLDLGEGAWARSQAGGKGGLATDTCCIDLARCCRNLEDEADRQISPCAEVQGCCKRDGRRTDTRQD